MYQRLFRTNLGRGTNGGVMEHKASLIVVDKARPATLNAPCAI